MPRKSDAVKAVEAASAALRGEGDHITDSSVQGLDAFEMPKTVVQRITKSALPDNAKLGKEIPSAMQKAATVFISYLSSHAQEIAAERKQKTLNANHVMEAIKQLGWPDNKEVERDMKEELELFQTLPALKRKQAKERKKVADAREGEDEVPSDRPLRTKGPRSTRTSSRATSEAVLDPNRIIVEHDARAAADDGEAQASDEEPEEEDDEEEEEPAEPDVEDTGLGEEEDDDALMEE